MVDDGCFSDKVVINWNFPLFSGISCTGIFFTGFSRIGT